MNTDIENRIKAFEAANRQVKICWGGDGSLVSAWRDAKKDGRILLPIRNYARCPEHESFMDDLLDRPEKFSDFRNELRFTLHSPLETETAGVRELSLSETLVTNADVTEALRFDIYVNGGKYLGNVIATSVLVSTVFGSTGYWSSVTRTIFRDGFGLAFVAPTVGVSNLVLKPTDTAEIEFARACTAAVAFDKKTAERRFETGDRMSFRLSPDNVPVLGLAQFHCNACRARRSGTVLFNEYIK